MNRKMKESNIEGIGLIPYNWYKTKVGRIGKYINGYAFKPEQWGNKGTPIIRIQNLTNNKKEFNRFNGEIDEKYIINSGDYLISWSATLEIFKWTGERAYLNQHIFKAIPDIKIVDYDYFYWIAKYFIRELLNDTHGSAMKHVTKEKFDKFKIPLPKDKNEQRVIAQYLNLTISEIDNIISKTKVSIDEYKKYKYALITKCVTRGINKDVDMKSTDVDWIRNIPQEWKYMKLKYIFSIKKDIAGKEGFNILSVTQSGLKIKDISKNEGQISADYSKYQIVEKGDFVMNHMDLLTGWVDCSKYYGVTSPDYRVFKFKNPELYSPEYYTYIMQICYKNKLFYGLGQGVSNLGRWRLQTDKFLNFMLPAPPKEEQEQIVNYLDNKCIEVDNIIEQKQKLLVEMEAYKKSLIYECVTGKKEVK